MQECTTKSSNLNVFRDIPPCRAIFVYSFNQQEQNKEKVPKI